MFNTHQEQLDYAAGFTDGMTAVWNVDPHDPTRVVDTVDIDFTMAGNDRYGEGFNAANDARYHLDDWTAPTFIKAAKVADLQAEVTRLGELIAEFASPPCEPHSPAYPTESGTSLFTREGVVIAQSTRIDISGSE